MNNQHFLAVTALGSNRVGILEALTKVSKQCGCNILESKLAILGMECALYFHLAGTWNTIAKMEAALPQFAQQFEFAIQTKRTLMRAETLAIPYQIQVIAQDRAGLLNDLAQFFAQQGIDVDQMSGETFTTKSNTTMATLSLIVNIPAKYHIPTIRERFMTYCDDLNLDAVIEPFKNL